MAFELSTDLRRRLCSFAKYLAIICMVLIAAIVVYFLASADSAYTQREHDTAAIFDHFMDVRRGEAYNWLAELCDDYGPRQVGSDNLENAIDFVMDSLKTDGFDVHSEPVPGIPYWVRGDDKAIILEPRRHNLNILAIGGTVSGTIQAEVVVLRDMGELEHRNLSGKIVVFNQKWKGYKNSLKYRKSASKVADKGAVGLLVASITPSSLYSPHTGEGSTDPRIPAACITLEEAAMLDRWAARGKRIVIRLEISSHELFGQPVISRNVIFEIVGSEFPEEVIVLSGHLDSWDVGQGALDDGGACAAVREALLGLKTLALSNPKFVPKRTIRGIFWTGEEQGMYGAKQYFADHFNRYREKFVFVSESDMGAFKPRTSESKLLFRGNEDQYKKMKQIVRLINGRNVPLSIASSPSFYQGDVNLFAEQGVPAAHYTSDRSFEYYFRFHHSNADYVSIFEEGDLETVSAIFATIAHQLANMDSWQDR